MLERAERGLPSVETVIEPLHVFIGGPWLEGLADFDHPVHAGGVPGAAELVERLLGVLAGGLGIALGGFESSQVAEDDRPLLLVCSRGGFQGSGEGFPGLRKMARLELGIALERCQPDWREPGQPLG